jgi:hypothetical protein
MSRTIDDTASDTSKVEQPVKIFYSYAHEDEDLREKLDKHFSVLKQTGVIQDWHDRRISAGTEWKGAIDEHFETAEIILLLVSSDFLASEYCSDIEVNRAMERHESREARVIPIILRRCAWSDAPFGKLQPLPKNAKPIKSWDDQDEAFTDIVEGIKKVIQEMNRPPRQARRHCTALNRRAGLKRARRLLLARSGSIVSYSISRFLEINSSPGAMRF